MSNLYCNLNIYTTSGRPVDKNPCLVKYTFNNELGRYVPNSILVDNYATRSKIFEIIKSSEKNYAALNMSCIDISVSQAFYTAVDIESEKQLDFNYQLSGTFFVLDTDEAAILYNMKGIK